jgi:hypothetical protein
MSDRGWFQLSLKSLFLLTLHHTIAEMPASSRMMLTPVQTTASPVGRLPTSGSWGQLCV